MKLYGIKNCDTVRKARKWLSDASIQYQFYDYQHNSLDTELLKTLLKTWITKTSLEKIINKRSSTYQKLNDIDKNNLKNIDTAINVIITNPLVIKRPIIDTGKKIIVGFDIVEYKKI